MQELETQVAKILISNSKAANAYVFVMAEKAADMESELYTVIEMPVFNPAAQNECERIAQAIGASLKRSYRRQINENTFETALAQINEELAKLASLGQSHWMGKLNAIIAVKTNTTFNLATTGKVSALLFRDSEFTNIADSPKNPHPLKTFENFATGKIRLHDFLILSTSQLLNYLSIDRLKNIILEDTLPIAGQKIIHILQDNAGPEVAFGTLITLQVENGATQDNGINLEEFIAKPRKHSLMARIPELAIWAGPALRSVSEIAWKKVSNLARGTTPKLSVTNLNIKSLMQGNRPTLDRVVGGMRSARNRFSLERFKQFSGAKKFFFFSVILLFLVLLGNILISNYYKNAKITQVANGAELTEMQRLIDQANSQLLYRANDEARNLALQLEDRLGRVTMVAKDKQSTLDSIKQQAAELISKIERTVEVKPETISALGSADRLIILPEIFAVQVNRTIVSYNQRTGSTQDGILVSAEPIISSKFIKGAQAVIYNGDSLYLWNYTTGILGAPYNENVPKGKQLVGLASYPTNNRVYGIDKKNRKVISFHVGDKAISKPVVSIANIDTSEVQDLAIDGSIYILKSNTVEKYLSGALQTDFKFPTLFKPINGPGKIITDKNFQNVYVLDKNNNRIIIFDKKGNLVQVLTSNQFTNLKDFSVDEKNKTIFVLNDASLVKFGF